MPSNSTITALDERVYDARDRAIVFATLDSNGGNVRQTSRQIGVPGSTIRGWLKRPQDGEEAALVSRIRARKRRSLSDKFKRLAHKAVGVASRKVDDLNGYQATLVAGIATDKAALLDGMPTQIIGTADPRLANLTVAQLAAIDRILGGELPAWPADGAVVDALDAPQGAPLLIAGQAVQTDAERPGDAPDMIEGGLSVAGQESGHGADGQPRPATERNGRDLLVGQDGPQA